MALTPYEVVSTWMLYSSISVIRHRGRHTFVPILVSERFPGGLHCPCFITDHYDGVVLRHEFPQMKRRHCQVPKNPLEDLPYTVPADVDAFRRARVGANIRPAR